MISREDDMLIKWLGHASFLITSGEKIKIITDPYTIGNGINYKPINESADIVTRSHGHGDHNNTKSIKGNPAILTEPGSRSVKGIEIKGIQVFHDEAGGNKRGTNVIFCFKVDGMELCHMGDLGHQLSRQQLSEIGPVDILFIPVGGFFTIDAREATAVARSIKPKVIFPMHYKTSKVDYPITGVDDFLKDKVNVRRLDASEIEIKKADLPKEAEIIVLQSAC
jgi:L-ascorbate metabolism protein UlaG (beta-lactamase superfamily)